MPQLRTSDIGITPDGAVRMFIPTISQTELVDVSGEPQPEDEEIEMGPAVAVAHDEEIPPGTWVFVPNQSSIDASLIESDGTELAPQAGKIYSLTVI